jgi:hypothetical protein
LDIFSSSFILRLKRKRRGDLLDAIISFFFLFQLAFPSVRYKTLEAVQISRSFVTQDSPSQRPAFIPFVFFAICHVTLVVTWSSMFANRGRSMSPPFISIFIELDRLQFTFGFGGIVDLFIELRLVE